MHHFVLPAIWGLLGFVSWIGWGILLGYWVDRERRFDPGICAGWGMAFMLAIGGVLNATWCCGWTATITLVCGGCAILLRHLIVHRAMLREYRFARSQLSYIPYLAAALFVYGASVCWMFNWNGIDDFPAYLVYPLKMLHAGAAIEPFSMRRLSTFGGYSFLQSVVSPFSWPSCAMVLDIGLGGLGSSLIVVCFLRSRRESDLLCALAGIAFLMLPIPRINGMSTMVVVSGILTFYCTFQLYESSSGGAKRRLLLVASVVAAGLMSFRPVLLPFIGMTLVLYKLLSAFGSENAVRISLTDCGIFCFAFAAILIPWSISLYFAGRSPLWPLFPGNYNQHVNFTDAHLPFLPLIGFMADVLTQIPMLIAIGTVFLMFSNFRPFAVSMLIAAVLTTIMTVKSFTLSDTDDLSRYTMPLVLSAGTAVLLSSQLTRRDTPSGKSGRLYLVVACLLLIVCNVGGIGMIECILSWQRGVIAGGQRTPPMEETYLQAQAHVPPRSTILNLAEFPLFFDYSRNPIYGMDWPGMASPPPGLPLGKGAPALLEYLRGQSINYLICDDFDSTMRVAVSSRPFMQMRMAASPDMDVHVPTDQRVMPTCLQTMADIDALKEIDPPIYQGDGLFVLRIKEGGLN